MSDVSSIRFGLDNQESIRFGDWLSGFVDGEGCFTLPISRTKTCGGKYDCRFMIRMRLDDKPILDSIRSFLRCGNMHVRTNVSKGEGQNFRNTNPSVQLYVSNLNDLALNLVPFFDKHPLRAKKARDYAIWRSAVLMCYQIKIRPYKMYGYRYGGESKWTKEEMGKFEEYSQALKTIRKYSGPEATEVPTIVPIKRKAKQPSLGVFRKRLPEE